MNVFDEKAQNLIAYEIGKHLWDRPIENGDQLAGMFYIGAITYYCKTRPPLWCRALIACHPRFGWERYDGHTIHQVDL